MNMFADLIFLSPWMLAALAAVPVLWWLLRVLPPRPRTVIFSAFFFLKDLETPTQSAAHTPWWLLLLRSLIIISFIGAFAEPVLHPAEKLPGGDTGSVLMIVDNSWASAHQWKVRQEKLKEYLRKIDRSGRSVIFVPTAPAAEDAQLHSAGLMPAEKGAEWVNKLQPLPWPADNAAAVTLVKNIKAEQPITHSVYFSAGQTAPNDLLELADTVVSDEATNNPLILREGEKPGEFSLERLHKTAQAALLKLTAYTDDGAVADELKIEFPANKTKYVFSWDLPSEIRNKTARLALQEPMASTVFLVGSQWRQHPVGILATTAQKDDKDFLDEVYYLKRALVDNNQITIDVLDTLLKQKLSALILPDSTPLTPVEKATLADWVKQGGFLIRFAGPTLAAQPDDILLPVPLRQGQRNLQGAMTWEKPAHLAAIARQSPLFGLSIPADVTVTRQLLAEPAPETFEKTWLQLEDGTPLITGGRSGKGTLVLIHTSAGPDWSDFCYSGLYVEALRRMVSLSNGISEYKASSTLVPLLLMDGFGRLSTPSIRAAASALNPDQEFEPSPLTPPGIYGSSQDFRAFNLGASLSPMQALNLPLGMEQETYQKAGERDLKPFLIATAVLLLLAETLLTFWMRGIVAFASLLFAVFLVSAPGSAMAADAEKDLVLGVYLGYIRTGDPVIDRTSFNGLTGLGQEVAGRTTAKIRGVHALDPEDTKLPYYPVLYWPMTEQQPTLSETGARNIQNYLNQGGLIIFDTRDRQFGENRNMSTPGARQLRQLTQTIQIPELVAIPANHILTKSFYLLDDFPGRYTGGRLWVEKEPNPHHDAVTSVIIGSNDWAAAWSKDSADRARYMIEPGGERQREMAYRVGINIMMASLAGSYKADQIHIPYILERNGP